jgi:hypothetical protein
LKQDRLFRAAAVQATAAGATVRLLSPDREWIVLDDTARRIWERLDYPASVGEVAASLACEYDASVERIREDVARIVAELVRRRVVAEDPGPPDPIRARYLSLLKRALGNMLYPELELQIEHLEQGGEGLSGIELQRSQRDIIERQPDQYAALMAGKRQGTAPLRFAHTMIGLFRLANIERCAEAVFADGVPGDFLEAGVCKGGAAIFMRALQVAHAAPERRTWVADSFAGVPPSEAPEDAAYGLHLEEGRQPWLACSEGAVREHFRRYDLLDANVRFLPGRLADTLPSAPTGPLAILRIDVDLYSSTAQCLDLLYDRVSRGGFVIVDDYGYLRCCRDAVNDFRRRRGVEEPIRWVDGSGIYWRKGEAA